MKRLLIVEDNVEYLELLSERLREYEYEVDTAETPIKGLELVALNQYDLVISDLNLPVMSGIVFVESVKNIAPKTACIILTGDPDEASEVQSVEKNIDLYIEKDKSIPVLVSYIEKLTSARAKNSSQGGVLLSRVENITLDTSKHSVIKEGKEIDLTPKEYEVLKLFLENKNELLSRDLVIERIWHEPSAYVDPRVVDSHVKNLREKLKSISIMTVRGYGYKWNE